MTTRDYFGVRCLAGVKWGELKYVSFFGGGGRRDIGSFGVGCDMCGPFQYLLLITKLDT